MGLDIKTYHWNYSALHRLRSAILIHENIIKKDDMYFEASKEFYDKIHTIILLNINKPYLDILNEIKKFTNFPSMLIHSDADGYYSKGFNDVIDCSPRFYQVGNLDELKKEVNQFFEGAINHLKGDEFLIFRDFYHDVITCKGKRLKFY